MLIKIGIKNVIIIVILNISYAYLDNSYKLY
jgi:hypothetical protein